MRRRQLCSVQCGNRVSLILKSRIGMNIGQDATTLELADPSTATTEVSDNEKRYFVEALLFVGLGFCVALLGTTVYLLPARAAANTSNGITSRGRDRLEPREVVMAIPATKVILMMRTRATPNYPSVSPRMRKIDRPSACTVIATGSCGAAGGVPWIIDSRKRHGRTPGCDRRLLPLYRCHTIMNCTKPVQRTQSREGHRGS